MCCAPQLRERKLACAPAAPRGQTPPHVAKKPVMAGKRPSALGGWEVGDTVEVKD